MPSTSVDAPGAVASALVNTTAIYSFVDYLMSGVFVRFPNLKVMYSEGQAGWLPFMLNRVDIVWDENRAWGGVADKVPNPPSSYVRDHVYFCVFQDKVAFENLDTIPVENITYETDYPHSDSTWPRSKELAAEHMSKLTQEQVDLIVHDNAVRLFGLTPEGYWQP
jgi:predicted TIM-barrel fold metal-dependent hydrolase